MAYGSVSDGRAEKAAQDAVASPLLEDVDLSGARGVLVNITAGMDLGLDEFYTVGDTIRAFASDEATVVVGTTLVPEMTDEIRVTIVATGIGDIDTPDIQILKHPPVRPEQQVNHQGSLTQPQPISSGVGYGELGSLASGQPQQVQQVQNRPSKELDTPAFQRVNVSSFLNKNK